MKVSDGSARVGNKPLPGVSTSAAAAPAAATAPVRAPDPVDQTLLGLTAADMTPRVREVLMTLMAEVENLRRDLDRSHQRITELEKLADSDTLSPIANRRAFVRELTRVMSYAERYAVATSLLFFDVNGLKSVNDTLGHAAGDAVLIHVAETLRANIRASDVVGRLGGDEYAVILTHADDAQAHIKAEYLAGKIREYPARYEEHLIPVSAAVGVYTFGPGESPTDVLTRADKAMYDRKRAMKAAE